MPELPEVEVIKKSIVKTVTNQTVTGVWTSKFKMRSQVRLYELKKLVGKRVLKVFRRAKFLVLEFDNFWLLTHFGMSGRLIEASESDEKVHIRNNLKHIHFSISLGSVELFLQDYRRFGGLRLLEKKNEHSKLEDFDVLSLGIEPLSDCFSSESLFKLTRSINRPIKNFLMDGKYISGLGNIYVTEALFRAGIHPMAISSRLGKIRCSRLCTSIKTVLIEAIKSGGSTLKDFSSTKGEKGKYINMHLVYGKKLKPCPICNISLSSISISQRTSIYCKKCQLK